MAEPARKTPLWEIWEHDPRDDAPEANLLLRLVPRSDGRMEPVYFPLTPELFLNPQLEDKMVQGGKHVRTVFFLFERLIRHLRPEDGFTVFSDLQHIFGPGFSKPSPDISVVRGLPDPDPDIQSYRMRKTKIPPCLIIEAVSATDSRVRITDEVDKVSLYERVGVEEYLLVDLPRHANGHRYRMRGYRLDRTGHYQVLEPDSGNRLASETTGLAFAPSADGATIDVFDLATGKRILTPDELVQEIARLQDEIQRLGKPS